MKNKWLSFVVPSRLDIHRSANAADSLTKGSFDIPITQIHGIPKLQTSIPPVLAFKEVPFLPAQPSSPPRQL
jgi:hypothetical protein